MCFFPYGFLAVFIINLSYLFNGEILLQNKELYGPFVFHLTFVNRYL